MNVRFLHSLQLKLAVGFLLVSLVPLGVVRAIAVRTADQLIASIVGNQLENVASEKQQLLQRWVAERKADLEVIAASDSVRKLDAGRMASQLRAAETHYQVYRRFVVCDADGRAVYDSGGPPGGDWSAAPWFARGIRGERFLSPVSVEAAGSESVFQLAAPIAGGAPGPQGVICATVSTAGIVRWVLRVALGETGECYLVDRSGTFLAHRDPQRILRDNIASSESFTNIFDGAGPRPLYTDYRGIAVLGASRAIAGTPWYVVVEQDRDEAFAASDQLRGHIRLAIGLTVLAVVAISLGLAFYTSRPIRRLNAAVDALSRGEFDSPLVHPPSVRRDEIGQLHTAFEQMARQLGDRHGQLQTRVGRTEAELQQTDLRLRQAIEAAAASERLGALGRLAAGVAHEIRTPLASLKLYLQSVREDLSISPEWSEDFAIAMRQVERIEATVNHFLNFARPREPVFTAVDFRRLIDDALEVVRPRANQQGVQIHVTLAADLPRVQGDVWQLGQTLLNLLVNALEEMPEGGEIRITAAAAEDPEGGPPGVMLELADSGPGIGPADGTRLFEPFFTTKASGSGLGLAIVKGTIERHGGTVTARGGPHGGAVFSLFLPATGG